MAEELKFQITIGGEAATQKAVEDLTKSVQSNIDKLQAQKALLSDVGFQKAQAEAAKLRNEIEELTKPEHAKGFQALKEGISDAAKEIPGATNAMNGFGGALKAVSNPLIAIPAALVGASVAALEFAHSNAEATVELVRMSQKTGISVNALAALKKQGDFVGIGLDTIGMAVGRLNVQLGENSKGFRDLGINTRDPLQALAQLADKMKAAESASDRARMGQEAMGRGYKELLPLLMEGGDAIRKAADSGTLSEGLINRYERIHKAQTEIDQSWASVKKSIGDIVSGPLQTFLEKVAAGAKDVKNMATSVRVAVGESANEAQLNEFIGGLSHFSSQGRKHVSRIGLDNVQSDATATAVTRVAPTMQEFSTAIKKQPLEMQEALLKTLEASKDIGKRISGATYSGVLMQLQDVREKIEKDKNAPRTLSDEEKALAERRAIELQKYRGINEAFSLGYGNAAEDQRRIAKIENTYREEEHSLKAHGALLVEMERAKNNEIQQIRDKALMQEFERQREDSQNQDKIVAERRQRILEDKKLEVEAAQLRFDRSSIESPKPHNFFPGKDDHSASDKIARENLAQQRIDSVSRNIELEQAQNNQFKIDAIKEKYALRDMQRQEKLAQALFKEHEAKIEMTQKEADLVQGFSSRELSQAIQGKLTIKSLEADMTSFLADQFAERTTKWIEQSLLEKAFSEGQSAAQIAETQAQASLAASAWSPAAISASIVTFGAASATGEAAYFQALASGQIAAASMIPHARGGMVFGTALKQPEETWTPVQPSRINPVSSSTTNHYGGPISITISGAGNPRAVAREVAKVLPRAAMLAAKNRSGTSR